MMTEVAGTDERASPPRFSAVRGSDAVAPELDQLLRLYRENLEKFKKDPAAAKAMARSELPRPSKEMNPAELAAWTVVANVLLNLDETVTKD